MPARVQFGAFICLAATLVASRGVAGPISVPMTLENNRPYIDVAVARGTGRPVVGHFYLDTGGGALVVTTSFARKAGLHPIGRPQAEDGAVLTPVSLPELLFNGNPIFPAGVEAFATSTRVGGLQGTDADGVIPARALKRHVITFDFPGHKFELTNNPPASARRIPGRMTKVGMPVVEFIIGGKARSFLLDTGATYSMMMVSLMRTLHHAHHDWPYRVGAIGAADMLLGAQEANYAMLRVARAKLGHTQISGLGFVSRPDAAYTGFMSKMLETPVVGSIGDNVWRHVSVTLDYPHGTVLIAGPGRLSIAPSASAELTVEQGHDGLRIVAAGADCSGLKKGDVLVRAGNINAQTATLAGLVGSLSGTAGSPVTIAVRRQGNVEHATCRRAVVP